MKIARHDLRSKTYAVEVSGPTIEDRAAPCLEAGFAYALDLASRNAATYYIREFGDVVARAEPTEGGGARLIIEPTAFV
jgi:hypothetical protein